MFYLVTGGSASGKSAWAEALSESITEGTPGTVVYLATMQPEGREAMERIKKHRLQREGRGFLTVERSRDLTRIDLAATLETPSDASVVLLECLGTLLANEMFSDEGVFLGREHSVRRVIDGVEHLRTQVPNLVAVTNEVGSAGCDFDILVLEYIDALGEINCRLASDADVVVEVVAGMPNVVKGKSWHVKSANRL